MIDVGLIPENMYNPEDCTNDGSCIQNPDENNLFTGFNGNKKNAKAISNLNFKIAKMDNNIKNMKNDEGIFIEHFKNERSPQELNDIIQPFNTTIIKPYESNSKPIDNIKTYDMMETGGSCFHCKVGTCEGGVCKSINNQIVNAVNTYEIEQSKMASSAHPYSDSQPTIQISNPDAP